MVQLVVSRALYNWCSYYVYYICITLYNTMHRARAVRVRVRVRVRVTLQ